LLVGAEIFLSWIIVAADGEKVHRMMCIGREPSVNQST